MKGEEIVRKNALAQKILIIHILQTQKTPEIDNLYGIELLYFLYYPFMCTAGRIIFGKGVSIATLHTSVPVSTEKFKFQYTK